MGPYTPVHCALSLLKSTVRTSPLLQDNEYVCQGRDDPRFIDYTGAIETIVTSTAQNDDGQFETNLHAERFLPFEGSGTEGTLKIDLVKEYAPFEHRRVPDVILRYRYTARLGVEATKVKAALNDLFLANSNLAGFTVV